MLIFYADKVLVMGHSRNSRFYSKSRRLDANEIFMFYTIILKLAELFIAVFPALKYMLHRSTVNIGCDQRK